MGLPVLAHAALRGSGGHISVGGVAGVVGVWRLNQRRVMANITTTGSNLHQGQLPVYQTWDFLLDSIWDTLKITPNVWSTLHQNFSIDAGFLGPLQLDVGESGAFYSATSFVLDLATVINAAEDAVRVQIAGSCSVDELTFFSP